jgi:hypothetical protein
MNKNTKIMLIVLAVLIVGAAGTVATAPDKKTAEPGDSAKPLPIASAEKTKTYVDEISSVFSFEYDPTFELEAPEMGKMHYGSGWSRYAQGLGYLIVRISVPTSYRENTNLSEAYFKVGRSTDSEGIQNCAVPGEGEKLSGSVTVSGYPFAVFTSADAGAGNFYEVTSYRGIVDGDCYALEYTLHSTNIGNYPPEEGIREFDHDKVASDMEKIVQSFRFLINSD